MRIWLDQVREEPFTWRETENIAVAALDRPELLELGPVTWEGEVVYADPGFLLRGRLTYEQTLGCIRCLAPHTAGTSAEVELLILVEKHQHAGPKSPRGAADSAGSSGSKRPVASIAGYAAHNASPGSSLFAEGDEMELSDSDVSTLVVEDEVLETLPIVIEQLQLNIPMKPLCRDDCRGLCPSCGADLNELESGRCDCAAPAPDPRWAALASIKGRLAETD
jgi:uncharacterized protein